MIFQSSGRAATKVINQLYEKFKPAELSDTEVMYLHAHGPGLVHTKDKPARKMEDMKGLKFRAHGTSAKVVEALGGTPVPQPMPETYQMLQKGVVDGAVYPWESNKGWRLGEVTQYCTANFSAAYTTSFFVVMNKKKWSALPEDIQLISLITWRMMDYAGTIRVSGQVSMNLKFPEHLIIYAVGFCFLILSAIVAVYLLGGCIMDALALVMLTIPIFYPVIVDVGYDPIWFGPHRQMRSVFLGAA
jgi:hypothetical protein